MVFSGFAYHVAAANRGGEVGEESSVVETLGSHGHPSALRALRVLKRQWLLIVLTTALVAGLATYKASRQPPLYQSTSSVLLKFQNLASGLTGIQDLSTVYQDPTRVAQTQTQIAMSPAVASRVARRADVPGLTAATFAGHSSVTAALDSDILDFTVTYSDPDTAQRLSTLHARQFIAHRLQLDTASLVAARTELRGRVEELRNSGFRGSELVAKLVENEQALRTMEALQTANASLLRPADFATQIQPQPVRNAVLGIVLGLMLGVGLAFGRQALDTRVRTAAEVGNALKLPLLARVPTPAKKLRSAQGLVMLRDPHGPQAEAFRMLRSNLEFVNLDRGARSIMVTSALEKEGKSTTIANLAIVLARAGKRVALIDLDLRRPMIGSFFGVTRSHPGITNVVLGHATLADALMESFRLSPGTNTSSSGNGRANGSVAAAEGTEGVLAVLTAGAKPPDPGEFVGSPRLARVITELTKRFDFVLIDTPPLLAVGDALTLSSRVDAMIVVTRLDVVKRPIVQELDRALATCPTIKLGFVATGVDAESGYAHTGYAYYDGRERGEAPAPEPRPLPAEPKVTLPPAP